MTNFGNESPPLWPPVTPHDNLFRSALREVLTAERFAQFQQSALRMRVLLSRGPSPSRLVATGLAVLAAARARKPRWLTAQVVEANTLASSAELIELIMTSSAFPPFLPLPQRDGRAFVDGGTVQAVPLSALDGARRPLVVLTRPVSPRRLPPEITVVAPRVALGIAPWEASSEPLLRHAHDEGRRAGERFFLRAATQRCARSASASHGQ